MVQQQSALLPVHCLCTACALPVHRDVLRSVHVLRMCMCSTVCMCTACACAHVPLPLHVQVRQHERDRQSRDQREREAELSTPLQQQAVVKAQASRSIIGR